MCNLCGNTGLLPLVKPDGTVSQHAKIFCDCHPVYGVNPQPEHQRQVNPEDLDFPCSTFFRELVGPANTRSEQKPEPIERVVVHRHSDMGKMEYDMLQQLSRQVKYLARLDEAKKRKPVKKTTGYKGLSV